MRGECEVSVREREGEHKRESARKSMSAVQI